MYPNFTNNTNPYAQQLDPQLVQQMFAMHQLGPQEQELQRQRARALAMQGQGADQMRGVMFGRKGHEMYRAPGVANLGANLLGNYMAKRAMDDADVRERNIGVQRGDTARRYFEALANQTRRQQMPHMGAEGE